MGYLSDLRIPEGKSGKFSIEHKKIKVGQELQVVSLRDAIFTGQRPCKVLIDKPVTLHYLKEDGNVWMSDVPQEIHQHKPIVDTFAGDVLVAGLGLGYITQQLCKKKDVKSVTVVELQQDVINLVWKHLALNGKGTIIHLPIEEYLKGCNAKFNWFYADIWASDGETTWYEYVLPIRRLAGKLLPQMCIKCWQEDVMLGQVILNINSKLQLYHNKAELKKVKDYVLKDSGKIEYGFWKWYFDEEPELEDAMVSINCLVREYMHELCKQKEGK